MPLTACKLIGFYNQDEKCLLRGTNWVFNQSSLRFIFKGLISVVVRFSSYYDINVAFLHDGD